MNTTSLKAARMVCKKCGKIFTPVTLRERMTGTCNSDECYVPFSDNENIKHFVSDYTKFHYKCLKCGQEIHTNDKTERLCAKCRQSNKRLNSP